MFYFMWRCLLEYAVKIECITILFPRTHVYSRRQVIRLLCNGLRIGCCAAIEVVWHNDEDIRIERLVNFDFQDFAHDSDAQMMNANAMMNMTIIIPVGGGVNFWFGLNGLLMGNMKRCLCT